MAADSRLLVAKLARYLAAHSGVRGVQMSEMNQSVKIAHR